MMPCPLLINSLTRTLRTRVSSKWFLALSVSLRKSWSSLFSAELTSRTLIQASPVWASRSHSARSHHLQSDATDVAGDAYPEMPINNPVTTMVHYPRKVVRLAFRETLLTTQI